MASEQPSDSSNTAAADNDNTDVGSAPPTPQPIISHPKQEKLSQNDEGLPQELADMDPQSNAMPPHPQQPMAFWPSPAMTFGFPFSSRNPSMDFGRNSFGLPTQLLPFATDNLANGGNSTATVNANGGDTNTTDNNSENSAAHQSSHHSNDDSAAVDGRQSSPAANTSSKERKENILQPPPAMPGFPGFGMAGMPGMPAGIPVLPQFPQMPGLAMPNMSGMQQSAAANGANQRMWGLTLVPPPMFGLPPPPNAAVNGAPPTPGNGPPQTPFGNVDMASFMKHPEFFSQMHPGLSGPQFGATPNMTGLPMPSSIPPPIGSPATTNAGMGGASSNRTSKRRIKRQKRTGRRRAGPRGSTDVTSVNRHPAPAGFGDDNANVRGDANTGYRMVLYEPAHKDMLSCHQCKNKKKLKDVVMCGHVFMVRNTMKTCTKKYCRSCLLRFYLESPIDDPDHPNWPLWKCACCRFICCCAWCRKKKAKRLEIMAPSVRANAHRLTPAMSLARKLVSEVGPDDSETAAMPNMTDAMDIDNSAALAGLPPPIMDATTDVNSSHA